MDLSNWFRHTSKRICDPKDTKAACVVAGLLLLWEMMLCGLIIRQVPYTEIDWKAYMEQAETFLKGERDYREINGQTGPLVYPAGFLYIFSGLFQATGGGSIIWGQVIFSVLYLANMTTVFMIYIGSKSIPPWALVLLTLSKRMHSIFILRLFNDCVAMFLAHIALLLLMQSSIKTSIVMFSAAVSIKMNVLLMAPPVLAVVLMTGSVADLLIGCIVGILLQIFLGLPFLMYNPWSYLSRAFEFTRVFMYQWSVNWKFLPESVFLSRPFAGFLLIAHISVLFLVGHFKWTKIYGGFSSITKRFLSNEHGREANPRFVAWMVFTGNFIGIIFARSLHNQFYCWYFFSIPYILWHTNFPILWRVAFFTVIEIPWNIYPARPLSSIIMLLSHLGLLVGLFKGHTPGAYLKERAE